MKFFILSSIYLTVFSTEACELQLVRNQWRLPQAWQDSKVLSSALLNFRLEVESVELDNATDRLERTREGVTHVSRVAGVGLMLLSAAPYLGGSQGVGALAFSSGLFILVSGEMRDYAEVRRYRKFLALELNARTQRLHALIMEEAPFLWPEIPTSVEAERVSHSESELTYRVWRWLLTEEGVKFLEGVVLVRHRAWLFKFLEASLSLQRLLERMGLTPLITEGSLP